MDQKFPRNGTDEHAKMGRRRFIQKAGLMGLGALGMGTALEGLVPSVRAERSQPSGSQPALPSPQRKRKTVTELLTILQSHPGGSQAIEAARRGGAKLSLGMQPTQPPKLQGGPPVTFFSFSVVLVPGQLQAGNSWAMFESVQVLKNSAIQFIDHYKSNALFVIDFPKHGWYLLNIEGLQLFGGVISARIENGGQGGPTFQTWSYPSAPNAPQNPIPRSFPALLDHKVDNAVRFRITENGLSFLQFTAVSL